MDHQWIECRTRRATCDDGEDDTEMLTSGCDVG